MPRQCSKKSLILLAWKESKQRRVNQSNTLLTNRNPMEFPTFPNIQSLQSASSQGWSCSLRWTWGIAVPWPIWWEPTNSKITVKFMCARLPLNWLPVIMKLYANHLFWFLAFVWIYYIHIYLCAFGRSNWITSKPNWKGRLQVEIPSWLLGVHGRWRHVHSINHVFFRSRTDSYSIHMLGMLKSSKIMKLFKTVTCCHFVENSCFFGVFFFQPEKL